jgi:hypothetical protein
LSAATERVSSMAGEVRLAMRRYFDRLLDDWRRTSGSLPKAPWNEDADAMLYVGAPDEEEWVEWQPVPRSDEEDFRPVEQELEVALPPSVREYFSSYWFCSLGGKYNSRSVDLEPILPGVGLRDVRRNLVGYREAHGGRLDRVPIGVETEESLLVVVNVRDERIEIEDYELTRFEAIAESLADLIEGLR